jgi:hypothetical protein
MTALYLHSSCLVGIGKQLIFDASQFLSILNFWGLRMPSLALQACGQAGCPLDGQSRFASSFSSSLLEIIIACSSFFWLQGLCRKCVTVGNYEITNASGLLSSCFGRCHDEHRKDAVTVTISSGGCSGMGQNHRGQNSSGDGLACTCALHCSPCSTACNFHFP